ncbi:hypothetical protein [Streptomyces caatingaensis]|uniref:Uncharacterized protein n=1 Tax=Streptomyces caatingaensis TaxID=1678637 RepID=A0A0K9XIN3_9ACTN|nr:hypothetical protein [Streptomyces caatingaensis]KNB53220.1 hypothetical protein AC230_07170 [Streptomyces caatingaensis]
MYAPTLRRSARIVAAAGAAALMALTGVAASAQAAEGTFFYTRADTGAETFLGSTPNGQCLAIPGGARQATNDTDTDARLYTNSGCTSSSRFLGSRQSDVYSAPFPTFVKFG